MDGREVMTMQTYLVHFRDRRLALAVGAELEDRLARAGREAVALVPAGDGLGLTKADSGGREAGRGPYGAPHVVALYEEGLLPKLESLGLTAYVGVRPGEQPRIVRWGNGGAMLLPVTTARDLVDAVTGHTPWAPHAARMAEFASAPRRDAILPGPTPPAMSRKLAAAGIAGPLLLAGLPATAAGATPAPATHPPSAKAGITAIDTTLLAPEAKTTQRPVPVSTQAFLNRIESALLFFLQQTHQATANNAQATQALENQIMRLVNAIINAQPKTSPQQARPGMPPQNGNPGGTQPGSQGPGSSGSRGSGQQQPPGSQDQNPQNPQDQNQQNPGSQDSSTSQGDASSQGLMSSGSDTTSAGSASFSSRGAFSSGGGGSFSGGGSSSGGSFSGGASSSGGGSFSGGGSS